MAAFTAGTGLLAYFTVPNVTTDVRADINKIFSDQNVQAVNGVVRKLGEHYGDKESQKNPPSHQ